MNSRITTNFTWAETERKRVSPYLGIFCGTSKQNIVCYWQYSGLLQFFLAFNLQLVKFYRFPFFSSFKEITSWGKLREMELLSSLCINGTIFSFDIWRHFGQISARDDISYFQFHSLKCDRILQFQQFEEWYLILPNNDIQVKKFPTRDSYWTNNWQNTKSMKQNANMA